MSILPNLLLSLFLTVLFSFLTPIILVGTLLATTCLISYVPGFEFTGETGAMQILQFLAVFGSGYPIQGILTIALTCAFVGALFELLNFYRYQNLGRH